MSNQIIAGYEKGNINIPFHSIFKLCKIFNVSVDYLIAKPGSHEELINSHNLIENLINQKVLDYLKMLSAATISKKTEVRLQALSEIYSSENKILISEINKKLLKDVTYDVSKLDEFNLKMFLFGKIKTNPGKFDFVIDKYYLIYCSLIYKK